MKVIKKNDIRVIESTNALDFQNNFNRTISDLIDTGVEYTTETHIFETKYTAIFNCKIILRIPETIKDEYELQGIIRTCEDCPYYVKKTRFKGGCDFCKGELYHDDDVCPHYWVELERERNEAKNQDHRPMRQPSKLCATNGVERKRAK